LRPGETPLKSGLFSLLAAPVAGSANNSDRTSPVQCRHSVPVSSTRDCKQRSNSQSHGCNSMVAHRALFGQRNGRGFRTEVFVGRAWPRRTAIHRNPPGLRGNMQFKRWNIDRFIEVSKRNRSAVRFKILVFGGKDESALGAAFCDALANDAVPCMAQPPSCRSFELMSTAFSFFPRLKPSAHGCGRRNTGSLRFSAHVRHSNGPSGMHAVPSFIRCLSSVLPATRNGPAFFNCHNRDRFAVSHIYR